MNRILIAIGGAGLLWCVAADKPSASGHKKLTLDPKFYSEGVAAADFNRDGKLDVVSGPYWYEGPGFQKRHLVHEVKAYDPLNYSKNFLTYTYDFNSDSYPDIFYVGFPGEEASWCQNPGAAGGEWKRHIIMAKGVDNESPLLADVTGDGKPEFLCNFEGKIGYAQADWSDASKPWKYVAISEKAGYQRYTHGIGAGDINGDGRIDIIEVGGWWEQPEKLDDGKLWKKHPAKFGTDGAQMLVYDVDGDGINDIISVLHPHQYGLAWFKQTKDGQWQQNLIMGEKPEQSVGGLVVSQLHALDLYDVNGDGLKDIVTGKRFWAHGPKGDPDSDKPAMLFWLELKRDPQKGVTYTPHVVDDDSGVGMQVVAADFNQDGVGDFAIGNKKGTFVFLSERK